MARSRLQLHDLLTEVTEYVYFQPPSSDKMQYPCILYVQDGSSEEHANNELYQHAKRYQITVVDRDPDTEIADEVQALRYSSFERFFAVDDLNHFVFTLYF